MAAFATLVPMWAGAQDASFTVRMMTLETATQAARAALESCRKSGYQVAVAVVDRSGLTQILLRDRFAGPHTVEMAVDKAWTAASFRTSTSALAEATDPGKPMSGLRQRPRVVVVGGGLTIEAGGSLLGAIGVSGAPGGERDDACARAGIAAVQQNLDF
ncbi:MAG TPA: heme-binding protein [Burkholderiales bacterium]|nr:heme-binding protein [Burkholderiales bacterium]